MRLVNDLPWMRRERCDANIRRAINELRALALEDTDYFAHYLSMAETFEAAVKLLDAIEDVSYLSGGHSVRVPLEVVQ